MSAVSSSYGLQGNHKYYFNAALSFLILDTEWDVSAGVENKFEDIGTVDSGIEDVWGFVEEVTLPHWPLTPTPKCHVLFQLSTSHCYPLLAGDGVWCAGSRKFFVRVAPLREPNHHHSSSVKGRNVCHFSVI